MIGGKLNKRITLLRGKVIEGIHENTANLKHMLRLENKIIKLISDTLNPNTTSKVGFHRRNNTRIISTQPTNKYR